MTFTESISDRAKVIIWISSGMEPGIESGINRFVCLSTNALGVTMKSCIISTEYYRMELWIEDWLNYGL